MQLPYSLGSMHLELWLGKPAAMAREACISTARLACSNGLGSLQLELWLGKLAARAREACS